MEIIFFNFLENYLENFVFHHLSESFNRNFDVMELFLFLKTIMT